MAVLVVCPKCGKQIKAAEHQLGKKAKCPQCKEVIALEAAGNDSPTINFTSGATATLTKSALKPAGSAKQTEKAEWKVMTGEQQEYGPVTKSELDAWVGDGRVDKECQLLQEGWEQWRWADEVYPQLTPAEAAPPPAVAIHPLPPTTPFTLGVQSGGPSSSSVGIVNPFVAPSGSSPRSPTSGSGIMPGGGSAISPAGGPPNPFASPMAGPGAPPGSMTGEITTGVLTALRNTQVWVLVFVVITALGFVGSLGGAMVYMALLFALVGARAVMVLIVFAPSVVLSGVFTWLLYSYYAAIGDVSRQPTNANLQKAMEAQQRFWMVAGMTVIISLLLQVLLVVVFFAIFAAALAAAGAGGGAF